MRTFHNGAETLSCSSAAPSVVHMFWIVFFQVPWSFTASHFSALPLNPRFLPASAVEGETKSCAVLAATIYSPSSIPLPTCIQVLQPSSRRALLLPSPPLPFAERRLLQVLILILFLYSSFFFFIATTTATFVSSSFLLAINRHLGFCSL